MSSKEIRCDKCNYPLQISPPVSHLFCPNCHTRGIPDSVTYAISDKAHFLCGALFTYVPFAWWGWHASMIGCGLIMTISGLKEAFYDPVAESKELAGSGLRDWGGYCLGAGLSLLSLYLKVKFGHN